GRTHKEIEALIGFFVNTLVLRTDLHGNPSFEELLARVRRAALDAYAHQEVPFERLVEELEPDRDLSSTPLFQVMLVLQNAPRTSPQGPGPEMSPLPGGGGTTKFDLTLSLQEGASGVRGSLTYSTDLFDPTTARRLRAHFERLLAGIVEDPGRRLGELALLSAAEQQALVREWNDTATGERFERPVYELVAMQGAERPEAVAVAAGGRVLTYRELGRRAAQLAQQLGRRGVGRRAGPPEQVVALCMERSPELVVGMLGI
ncbi:MAG: AMP-binding protein, partial [bacterium]|nr:AMP-binding protein [bacterium]